MLKNSLKNISILVPIFRGGDLFLGALESIERSGFRFENIFISFNEAGNHDYDNFVNACHDGKLKLCYTVFRTGVELDVISHSRFMVEKIREIVEPISMLFLLAHDDRIINNESDASANLINKFFLKIAFDTVYFPSYSCCSVINYDLVYKVIESDLILSPNQFFWLTQKENIATNMSGMIVPFSAWDETIVVMEKYGSGARFEHLLAISHPVNSIQFHKNVRTLVASRVDSDGALLTGVQHRRASLHYLFTFAVNGRLRGQSHYLLFARELVKKIIGLAIEYIKRFQIFRKMNLL